MRGNYAQGTRALKVAEGVRALDAVPLRGQRPYAPVRLPRKYSILPYFFLSSHNFYVPLGPALDK